MVIGIVIVLQVVKIIGSLFLIVFWIVIMKVVIARNILIMIEGLILIVHIHASAAKKAANQYRKTRSQLMKLAAEPGEAAQAQALEAVAAYTQTFNKMGFIGVSRMNLNAAISICCACSPVTIGAAAYV